MGASAEINSIVESGTDISLPPTIKPYFQVMLTDLPTPSGYIFFVNGQPVQGGNWTFPQAYEARIPLTGLQEGQTYKMYMEIGFTDGQTVVSNTATLHVMGASATPEVIEANKLVSASSAKVVPASPATLSVEAKYGIALGVIAILGIGGYLIYDKVIKK